MKSIDLAEGEPASTHLVRLGSHGRLMWRDICVRAPGFPAELVLLLADETVCVAADAYSDALEKRCDVIDTQELATHYEREFAKALQSGNSVLSGFAHDGALREAIAWQNQAALHNVLNPLRQPALPNAKTRQREEKLASYIQRYCVKNDTIGFFGPVGWARWSEVVPDVRLEHPVALLARREVFFEDWAVRAIAAALANDTALLPWQVPSRKPHLPLIGRTLVLPGGDTIELSTEERAILIACNGTRNVATVAATVLLNPLLLLNDAGEVQRKLVAMERRGLVSLDFPLGMGELRPESSLRKRLSAIDSPELRTHALAPLNSLDAAMRRLTLAEGDAEKVDAALTDLNMIFERVAGTPSYRRAGQTYGARTVVYQDCQRDLHLEFGDMVMRRLERPLSLVLDAADWYCQQASLIFQSKLNDIYTQLCARPSAKAEVSFVDFWARAQQLLFEGADHTFGELDTRFRLGWKRILNPSIQQARTDFLCEDIETKLWAEFEVNRQAPSFALHHSPDLMICAANIDDIREGTFVAVLGELHMGLNTLMTSALLNQHPMPDSLLQLMRTDSPKGRVHLLLSPSDSGQPNRTRMAFDSSCDTEIVISHDARALYPATAMLAADLVVVAERDGLEVLHLSSQRRFNVLDVFRQPLSYLVTDRFDLAGEEPKSPRITIDSLVVQRACWRAPCAEAKFAWAKSNSEIFRLAREFQRARGLPQHVFAKLPHEKKPFYVDFSSPVLVRILAKQMRSACEHAKSARATVALTEFLPGHNQLWLRGPEGRAYTSELRMAAVGTRRGR